MAAIKSYSDLQQSEKLSEILPLESADMKILPFTEREYRIVPINDIAVCGREDEIYAWSLAALLKILNFPSLTQNKEDEWEVCVFDHNNDDYIKKIANNPVDACYEMIIWLSKLKMLLL